MSKLSRLAPGLRSIIQSLGGLVAVLDGRFDGTTPYRIDVNEMSATAKGALLTSCTLSPAAGADPQLKCSSAVAKLELFKTIRLQGIEPAQVLVTVSVGDTKLGEQMFEPAYSSEEINGSGCGVCTSAQASVTIP
jgi:hypothetical protein